MKLLIKNTLKQLLGCKKIRKVLWVLLAPMSFSVIKFYGVFDFNWYKLQFVGDSKWITGSSMALLHYLVHGRRRGLTPNPFFIPEYFEASSWQISIIDPFTHYLIDKKKWTLATSPIFNPQKFDRTGNLSKAPLVEFLCQLEDKTTIPVDIEYSKTTWAELKPIMYSANQTYKNQTELSQKTLPVFKFDTDLERQTIEKADEYSLESDTDVPLVSIIMPVWNRQEVVIEAIRSVQMQTFTNWELLITDDGSTDRTVEVIKGIQSEDSRIKLFQPGHGGVCRARNNSLEQSSGAWIAFLDSDNAWTPNYLQTMIVSLQDNQKKAAYSAIEMRSNDSIRYRTTEPDKELLKVGNYIDLNALVVRKSVLTTSGFFDETLRRMVDYDLICRISLQTDFIYVPIVGVIYTDHDDSARITTTELTSWDGVIKSKNWINWSDSASDRDSSLISIVVPVHGDIRSAHRLFKSLETEVSGRDDTEIIIADSSSTSAVNLMLSLLAKGFDTPTRHVRIPASHDNTLGANYGFSYSHGSTVIFIDQRVVVEPGWLKSLIISVRSTNSLVGSMQLKPSRLVHSAGEIFPTEQKYPVHLLEHHPQTDIRGLDDEYRVPALGSGVVALKADLFAELGGFYPLYNSELETHDLSLRAADLGYKSYIAKNSQIVNFNQNPIVNSNFKKVFLDSWIGKLAGKKGEDLWQKAGFEVLSYAGLMPKLRAISSAKRWAIKISSPPDERRFSWGDTYYAEALAAALERLGQSVAVDYHGHHQRSTSYLDDINLDLRGLDNFIPVKGKVNIMWVISHPDDVTPEMIQSFDKVYAAGNKWAEYMTKESGKTVEFLPQCTDPTVFYPTKPDPEFAGKVLFVGNSRNILRTIVKDSIAADLDLAVYGGGWEGLIDQKYIKGRFIPNNKLTNAYSSAKVVLNDHWTDMRQWGFLSNRLFDATSAGGRVITDDIEGIEHAFDAGMVQGYQTVDDLKSIISSWKDLSDTAYSKNSHQFIKANHSFDARAQDLVGYVESTKK